MEIKPYANNAKAHPVKQLELLAKVVAEVGWRQNTEVNQDGVIVAGHGRYMAWEKYKDIYNLPPIWITDDKGKTIHGEHATTPLTEEQEKMWRLADNQLNAMTDMDMNLVIEELKDLSEPMLELTGFDKDLIIEADEMDDVVPDVPVEPQSKLGDLYELGNHRVLCGDSTKIEDVERLMDGKKADMVFTDPPYGIALKVKKNYASRKKNKKAEEYETIIGDEKEFDMTKVFENIDSKKWWVWGADYLYRTIPNFKKGNLVVWAKRHSEAENKVFGSAFELCWVYPYCKKEIWFIRAINQSSEALGEHPTQKPTELGVRAISRNTEEGGVVVDAFLGSGSTLISCEKIKRKCYGIELSERYIDVIVSRYCDYTQNYNIKRNGEDIIWQKSK
jgi:site-specific DNA-methyltransferase (adenine-specific)